MKVRNVDLVKPTAKDVTLGLSLWLLLIFCILLFAGAMSIPLDKIYWGMWAVGAGVFSKLIGIDIRKGIDHWVAFSVLLTVVAAIFIIITIVF